jgi:hypothetical protein
MRAIKTHRTLKEPPAYNVFEIKGGQASKMAGNIHMMGEVTQGLLVCERETGQKALQNAGPPVRNQPSLPFMMHMPNLQCYWYSCWLRQPLQTCEKRIHWQILTTQPSTTLSELCL